MADVKISQLTAKAAKVESTDRIPIADYNGTTYDTKYVTGSEINEVKLDTSPQLGGNLDVNGFKIVSEGTDNVVISPNGAGILKIESNLDLRDTSGSTALQINLYEGFTNGSNYVGIKAPDSLSADTTYTLPTADGTSGQVLQTNGTGTLSWATASGGVPTSRNITINGTTQDLSADRTYTVTDANLSTSDVTTNNVSTSKHGFVPKASTINGSFLEVSGTSTVWTNIVYTIELINALTVDFYAPYNLKITSVSNVLNSPTTTVLDDGTSYTVGGGATIASGSKITITVNTAAVVNLNIEKA